MALIAGAEWTGLGLTAADWCAVLALVGSVVMTLARLIKVMDKLSSSVDRLDESNGRRDQVIDELSRHIQKHDEQFIKDEARINEIAKEIEEGDRKR